MSKKVHHSFRNLLVAVTGTGKTVIAAFDYRDFCRANPNRPNKLLFVAHRREILSQSLACFRGILKDLNFGSMELLEYYHPKVLLGLTANPERADGRSIYTCFQGRVVAEIPLMGSY